MIIKTLITARSNSSRLYNKILKNIVGNDKSIDILIKRAEKIGYPIILCTSNSKSDDKLINYVKKKHKNVIIFRGSLKNKLKRWYDCFRTYRINFACMVDGDDLSFCYKLYKNSIDLIKKKNLDLIKYSNKMIPGAFTYAISFNCLIKSKKLFNKHVNSEMVDPYFKNNKIKKIILPFPKYLNKNKNIRITMDYIEDLNFFRKLYNKNQVTMSLKNLISFLEKNKKIKKINYFRDKDWASNQTKLKKIIKL